MATTDIDRGRAGRSGAGAHCARRRGGAAGRRADSGDVPCCRPNTASTRSASAPARAARRSATRRRASSSFKPAPRAGGSGRSADDRAKERAFKQETVDFKVGRRRVHRIQVPARQGRGAAVHGRRRRRSTTSFTRSPTARRAGTPRATRRNGTNQAGGHADRAVFRHSRLVLGEPGDQEVTVTLRRRASTTCRTNSARGSR